MKVLIAMFVVFSFVCGSLVTFASMNSVAPKSVALRCDGPGAGGGYTPVYVDGPGAGGSYVC